jgi:hypothetical protein
MPVRLLSSSVLKWPDAASVLSALRAWAEALGRQRPEVNRVGYFGSYARGDWGVGSDLDVVIVVDHADVPFASRGANWDAMDLPVPTDVLVYTGAEWEQLQQTDRPRPRLLDEVRWIFVRSS